MFGVIFKILKILWAAPYTILGLFFGCLGLLTGGKLHKSAGAIEFYGGAVGWFLRRLPIRPSAMTLGHTIVGLTKSDLDRTRAHEMIHVRQYERWGFFFVPAYFLASLIAWWQGKNYYRDNAFEVEAYSKTETPPRPNDLN